MLVTLRIVFFFVIVIDTMVSMAVQARRVPSAPFYLVV